MRPSRSRGLFRGGLCLLVWLSVVACPAVPSLAQELLPTLEPLEEVKSLGTNEFGRPEWMAVIAAGEDASVLVGVGDAVFREGDSAPLATVRAVSPVHVVVRPAGTDRDVRVLPGRTLPGAPAVRLQDLVRVTAVEFRQRVLPRDARKTLQGEQYFVGLVGTRAILQRDVDPPPSPLELLARRLEAVRVAQVAPGTWEVNAGQLFETVRTGESVIWDTLRTSGVELSSGGGIGLEVKTPVVDAKVDRRGFVIASPKLAERAGLRMRDRILSVNDIPIDGFSTLVQVYQQLRTSPDVRTVRVVVERDAAPLTLTYRLR